ncbi:alpha/beta hydrolase [Serratia fonticola]|uniref:alpha/beta hydrolase n=1 Tax=Serratia fonticola TaxID=47917 RepID=UPI003BB79DF2
MPASYKITEFSTEYHGYKISADRWHTKGQLEEVILLHGGGSSSKAGFIKLRETLINMGLGSLSFDFLGHGQSEGNLEGFSLKDRVNQAKAIINSVSSGNSKINIMGFSMGAYIATLLTQYYKVSRLGLFIPAMYSREAYEVPFGSKFSKVIRKPKNWLDSDGFQIIKNFHGNLLIVSAENDEIVPAIIPELLYKNSFNSEWKHHYIIPKGTHNLSKLAYDAPHHRYSLLHNIFNWYSYQIMANKERSHD